MATIKKTGPKRSATIVNVAEKANVSIGTVSRYLNGYQIKEANRKRIEEAIAALSYSRNAFASAMKSEASNMVGLLVPNYDEFHAKLLGELATALRREGLVTLTFCHENHPEGMRDAVDFFRTHRVSALIMTEVEAGHDAIMSMVDDGVQVITFDNSPTDDSIDGVVVDNRQASKDAVNYLMDLGHSDISIVTGSLEHWTAQQRYEGYLDAFKSRGMEPRKDLVFEGNWRRPSGAAALEYFWSLDRRPTALFGANHRMSLGALNYARLNNISIPDDISLISFDDIEMYQYLTPSITAIAQPVLKIADAIRRLLLRRIEADEGEEALVEVLECDFIKRNSVKALSGTKGDK